jgi:hypothetical protein
MGLINKTRFASMRPEDTAAYWQFHVKRNGHAIGVTLVTTACE